MALPMYTVFIMSLATLLINVNGQCGERTDVCGCNNPTTTTQRTIEIVRVREPEQRPLPEPTYDRRPLPVRQMPVLLKPTIQKYYVFPRNSQAVNYPKPDPQPKPESPENDEGFYMIPVAVRRKTIKKPSNQENN